MMELLSYIIDYKILEHNSRWRFEQFGFLQTSNLI